MMTDLPPLQARLRAVPPLSCPVLDSLLPGLVGRRLVLAGHHRDFLPRPRDSSGDHHAHSHGTPGLTERQIATPDQQRKALFDAMRHRTGVTAPAGSRHFGPSCFGSLTQGLTGKASIRSLANGTNRERSASAEERGSSHTPSDCRIEDHRHPVMQTAASTRWPRSSGWYRFRPLRPADRASAPTGRRGRTVRHHEDGCNTAACSWRLSSAIHRTPRPG